MIYLALLQSKLAESNNPSESNNMEKKETLNVIDKLNINEDGII